MDSRQQRLDDAYKRKLQRIKVKSVANPLKFAIPGKNGRCRPHPLKLVLAIIVLGSFFLILSSPPVCQQNGLQLKVSRWIWGASDPRYIADFEIDWNEIAGAVGELPKGTKIGGIGLVNFNEREARQWQQMVPTANHTVLNLDRAERNVTWDVLFPEWIDEEQDEAIPSCPALPRLQVPAQRLDLVAVKLPCRSEGNWSRDVARLHLQIAAAGLAAACKGSYPVHLLFVTRCFPIPNLFTCKDLVARRGNAWLYRPQLNALRAKLQLPIGSCELALPLGSVEKDYTGKKQREAYATILHSADVYVCGAIAAAQSIRMAGSTRDLVILVDETISDYHRSGLELAGWKVRNIKRIRNPKAEKDAYNEWNYSKFRLWQLTDYDKIIFIDADLLILRNIDFLFGMPEISATGNNGTLFNSGVMVIEPSNCTFRLLMEHINEIESYNGGDQGYLNEIFTWWHRIPKHMNFLKNFWIGDDLAVRQKKTKLFGAEPPVLYVLHYLGNKPWMCYRDYDCNWNVDILQEFASDVAHNQWWRVHDAMPGELREMCLLPSKQKAQLEWDRRQAEKGDYADGHWRIRIRDERVKSCIDPFCNWKGMLKHWGENNWTDVKFPVPTPPAFAKGSSLTL
ncbi:UDP-glucuronate:xylan alpha-glucuronosyltransferase 1-like isoform X2 [Salvia miltiorrhiza]|uniref:UDP-glucuronate:xylan alpha-glucuronosyltransferase 1-like isoform X2 n=1 Tax=Salvia miltiorrhiza TaxID=226208 RepID=UPI0025AC7DE6|nr:UDP-glucuronate:xylan alpha-glucuronosyltransferase 1-like isoform X2 [Salvia miltiorrhiza]XP_057791601.1 UDP-glucuronate:xylan alpha-glucuronosyltransferase 1-like isoform X2 [Salvia miltiorrhiza]